MIRLFYIIFGLAAVTLGSLPVSAADQGQASSPEVQQRELIYCAGQMTHEEREAYRARMQAAATPQAQAEVRQAHQAEMRMRVRQRGIDPIECEPSRHRERLRLRGGQ